MIAECHYKNGLIKYHEMPVPFPLNGVTGKPIFKIPEYVTSTGMTENMIPPTPQEIIHTFEYDYVKDVNGKTVPVFKEI